jgi:uncharacterized protein YbaA (DUF1428 family)
MAAKAKYVEGFLLAVPARNKAVYTKMAKTYAKVFLDLGALRLVEAWGDDVPKGKWTDFYRAVKAKKTERIVFAWVEWPSRKVRNAAMKKMMANAPTPAEHKAMPFDTKRMIFGGFSTIVDV